MAIPGRATVLALAEDFWRVPHPFAVGDVRHGSVKRVAAAVGEGSTAVSFVHEYLAEAAACLASRD